MTGLARADAVHIPLPENSVQVIVTSPPYFGLRDYGIPGQMGLELTLQAYIAKTLAVLAECWRVLRPDGVMFFNIGDSYASGEIGRHDKVSSTHLVVGQKKHRTLKRQQRKRSDGLRPKDLMLIPERVALAAQEQGWWVRSRIIWHKPNAMPESVTDRPTTDHEHIWLLTKSAHYFWDAEAVKELNSPTSAGNRRAFRGKGIYTHHQSFDNNSNIPVTMIPGMANEWTGRNMRSVWTIATFPYSESHYATFPSAIPRRCILAGTSPKACGVCGAPWERVTDRVEGKSWHNHKNDLERGQRIESNVSKGKNFYANYKPPETIGWQPTCSHSDDTGHCIVLDPFCGSGTTVMVAEQLGRVGIGLDLSMEYLTDHARRRTAAIQREMFV